jgi:hypothetical protein
MGFLYIFADYKKYEVTEADINLAVLTYWIVNTVGVS